MAFKKGQSGNLKGKPKGTVSRTTTQMRQIVTRLVDDNVDQLQADIDSLSPKDRVQFMLGLMNFVLPKYQAVAVQDFTEQKNEPQPIIVNFKVDDER